MKKQCVRADENENNPGQRGAAGQQECRLRFTTQGLPDYRYNRSVFSPCIQHIPHGGPAGDQAYKNWYGEVQKNEKFRIYGDVMSVCMDVRWTVQERLQARTRCIPKDRTCSLLSLTLRLKKERKYFVQQRLPSLTVWKFSSSQGFTSVTNTITL